MSKRGACRVFIPKHADVYMDQPETTLDMLPINNIALMFELFSQAKRVVQISTKVIRLSDMRKLLNIDPSSPQSLKIESIILRLSCPGSAHSGTSGMSRPVSISSPSRLEKHSPFSQHPGRDRYGSALAV